MRKVCRGLLITVLLLKVVHIYPQALLINFNSNIVENPMLVDKVIKENTNFINIDVEIPQIVGLANKDKEKVINKEILDWTDMWIKDVKDVSEEFN
ncbi:hypothetical protein GNF72_14840, partial [Clostridium perfringens]|nr:hypothetical protein [Clostridium perfringens]